MGVKGIQKNWNNGGGEGVRDFYINDRVNQNGGRFHL